MKKAYLIRDIQNEIVTLGMLVFKKYVFYTLENPWLDNQHNISCIPTGKYRCEFLKKSASGKYNDVYWVRDVPDRSEILIHPGNWVRNTKGCILIGHERTDEPMVTNSRSALEFFVELMKKEPFDLHILNGENG